MHPITYSSLQITPAVPVTGANPSASSQWTGSRHHLSRGMLYRFITFSSLFRRATTSDLARPFCDHVLRKICRKKTVKKNGLDEKSLWWMGEVCEKYFRLDGEI
ncbi:hypothetical protein NPIL_212941 [Nephila pilipes]|uniref:Uncharacterized protein n=1 Tax=Nephila pilipes TaxID=299642 RepID=A0A8X6ULK6_NEPPI|nr:hypothetical protein NPIL_212941 [Nephila pilipes]